MTMQGGAGAFVGQKVLVGGKGLSGTVRFRGLTQFAEDEWLGIELDEPVGKNDGSIQGVRYFSVEPKCAKKCLGPCDCTYGIFVRPNAVNQGRRQRSNSRPKTSAALPGSAPTSPSGSYPGSPAATMFPGSPAGAADWTYSPGPAVEPVAVYGGVGGVQAQQWTQPHGNPYPSGFQPQDLRRPPPQHPGTTAGLLPVGGTRLRDVQAQLAAAMEDRDMIALRRLIPEAEQAGVSLEESDGARRMLLYEENRDVNVRVAHVRSEVDALVQLIRDAEARAELSERRARYPAGGAPAAAPISPRWDREAQMAAGLDPRVEAALLDNLGPKLEKRVWDNLNVRIESAIEAAVESATASLNKAAREFRELSAEIKALPDDVDTMPSSTVGTPSRGSPSCTGTTFSDALRSPGEVSTKARGCTGSAPTPPRATTPTRAGVRRGTTTDEFFEYIDADKDGTVSLEELREAKRKGLITFNRPGVDGRHEAPQPWAPGQASPPSSQRPELQQQKSLRVKTGDPGDAKERVCSAANTFAAATELRKAKSMRDDQQASPFQDYDLYDDVNPFELDQAAKEVVIKRISQAIKMVPLMSKEKRSAGSLTPSQSSASGGESDGDKIGGEEDTIDMMPVTSKRLSCAGIDKTSPNFYGSPGKGENDSISVGRQLSERLSLAVSDKPANLGGAVDGKGDDNEFTMVRQPSRRLSLAIADKPANIGKPDEGQVSGQGRRLMTKKSTVTFSEQAPDDVDTQPDFSDSRRVVREHLLAALADGWLEQILADSKQVKDIDEIRRTTKAGLLASLADGSLKVVAHATRASDRGDKKDVRADAKDAQIVKFKTRQELLRALDDGTFQAAVSKKALDDTPDPCELAKTDLREAIVLALCLNKLDQLLAGLLPEADAESLGPLRETIQSKADAGELDDVVQRLEDALKNAVKDGSSTRASESDDGSDVDDVDWKLAGLVHWTLGMAFDAPKDENWKLHGTVDWAIGKALRRNSRTVDPAAGEKAVGSTAPPAKSQAVMQVMEASLQGRPMVELEHQWHQDAAVQLFQALGGNTELSAEGMRRFALMRKIFAATTWEADYTAMCSTYGWGVEGPTAQQFVDFATKANSKGFSTREELLQFTERAPALRRASALFSQAAGTVEEGAVRKVPSDELRRAYRASLEGSPAGLAGLQEPVAQR